MIKTELEIREEVCCLSAAGHANYAPYGQDIICAAVSALVQGLNAYGNEAAKRKRLCEPLLSWLEPGEAGIAVKPRKWAAEELCGAFRLAGHVLYQLAEHYPENISLSIIDEKETFK